MDDTTRHAERTYFGGPDTKRWVQGVPRVTGVANMGRPCPHCGCETLYDIVVSLVSPLLSTGYGIGQYVGCPACPFASPMLCIACRKEDVPCLWCACTAR